MKALRSRDNGWLAKSLATAIIGIFLTALTAAVHFVWDYKLDANRFVADSTRRAMSGVDLHQLDSVMRAIARNQEQLLRASKAAK